MGARCGDFLFGFLFLVGLLFYSRGDELCVAWFRHGDAGGNLEAARGFERRHWWGRIREVTAGGIGPLRSLVDLSFADFEDLDLVVRVVVDLDWVVGHFWMD